MDDRERRDHGPAQFEELQLRRAIDREVVLGRGHRIEVAGLAGEVEQEILAGEQLAQRRPIADIGNVDPHPLLYVGDVGKIPAGFGDHAVEEQHLGAERQQTPRQRRADEADAAGDHHMRAAEGGKTPVRIQPHEPSRLCRTRSGMPAAYRSNAAISGAVRCAKPAGAGDDCRAVRTGGGR